MSILVFRILGKTRPSTCNIFATELVVANAFVTSDIQDNLVALIFKKSTQFRSFFEDVVVVATCHATVTRDHQDCGTLAVLTLTEHGVIEGTCGRQTFHHIADLSGVRKRSLNPCLGLGDSRGGDQFLGFGDLLGRVHRLDSVT